MYDNLYILLMLSFPFLHVFDFYPIYASQVIVTQIDYVLNLFPLLLPPLLNFVFIPKENYDIWHNQASGLENILVAFLLP